MLTISLDIWPLAVQFKAFSIFYQDVCFPVLSQFSISSLNCIVNLCLAMNSHDSSDLSYQEHNWQLLEWECGLTQRIRELNPIWSDLLINALPFGACSLFSGFERKYREQLLGWTISSFHFTPTSVILTVSAFKTSV